LIETRHRSRNRETGVSPVGWGEHREPQRQSLWWRQRRGKGILFLHCFPRKQLSVNAAGEPRNKMLGFAMLTPTYRTRIEPGAAAHRLQRIRRRSTERVRYRRHSSAPAATARLRFEPLSPIHRNATGPARGAGDDWPACEEAAIRGKCTLTPVFLGLFLSLDALLNLRRLQSNEAPIGFTLADVIEPTTTALLARYQPRRRA
jgi:hypothetical protein